MNVKDSSGNIVHVDTHGGSRNTVVDVKGNPINNAPTSYQTAERQTVYVAKTSTGSVSGTATEFQTPGKVSDRANISPESRQQIFQAYQQEQQAQAAYKATPKLQGYGQSLEPMYSEAARRGYLISETLPGGQILFSRPDDYSARLIGEVQGQKRTTSIPPPGTDPLTGKWSSESYRQVSMNALATAQLKGVGTISNQGFPVIFQERKATFIQDTTPMIAPTPIVDFSQAMSKPTTGVLSYSSPLFATQRQSLTAFGTPLPAEKSGFVLAQSFVKGREELALAGTKESNNWFYNMYKKGVSLLPGSNVIYTESGKTSSESLVTPTQFAGRLVNLGAMSSMTDLARVNKPAANFIGIKATEGNVLQTGKEFKGSSSSILQFETSSILRPRYNVEVAQVSSGRLFKDRFASEIGLGKFKITSESKPIEFAKASKSIFTPEGKSTTYGEFITKQGKIYESSPFVTVGAKPEEIGGLKTWPSITAQVTTKGQSILEATRTTEIMKLTSPESTLINYKSIGAISSEKIPTPVLVRQAQGRAMTFEPLPKVISESSTGLITATKEQNVLRFESPTTLIQQQIEKSVIPYMRLERGLVLAPSVYNLARQSTPLISFGSSQDIFKGISFSNAFSTKSITIPGTTQIVNPMTGITPISMTGTSSSFAYMFGGSSSGATPSPTVPFIPPFFIGSRIEGDYGFKTSMRQGVGSISAKYLPNLRGLESGRTTSVKQIKSLYSGAEVRNPTKEMAKAMKRMGF